MLLPLVCFMLLSLLSFVKPLAAFEHYGLSLYLHLLRVLAGHYCVTTILLTNSGIVL